MTPRNCPKSFKIDQCLSLNVRKVIFGFLAGAAILFWLGALVALLYFRRDRYELSVCISNAAVLPALVKGFWVSLVRTNAGGPPLSDMTIDVLFLVASSTCSFFYHTCDATNLTWEIGSWNYYDEIGQERLRTFPFQYCVKRWTYENCDCEVAGCCGSLLYGDSSLLQGLDFTAAYFMVAMAFLTVAWVRPLPLKIAMYGTVMYFMVYSQKNVRRFKSEGTVVVLYCVVATFSTLVLRFILVTWQVKKKTGLSLCRSHAKMWRDCILVSWRNFAVYLLPLPVCLAIGLTCFSTQPDHNREKYALIHGTWHAAIYAACFYIGNIAVDFHDRYKALLGGGAEENEGGEQQSGEARRSRSSSGGREEMQMVVVALEERIDASAVV